MEFVAVIPAGGTGSRLSPLPFSKELIPLIIGKERLDPNSVPKPVSYYLLDAIRSAGIKKVFFVLKEGKWDIPAFFKDGSDYQMDFIYMVARYPHGTPFTINQTYEFVKNYNVFLGFPDIIFKPEVDIKRLLDEHKQNGADLTLGLYKTRQREKWDMVEVDKKGMVKRIVVKPCSESLTYAWFIAVWKPEFTEFLNGYIHNWLKKYEKKNNTGQEISVGHVIRKAVEEGMLVKSIKYPHVQALDIGTPRDFSKAVRDF